jgi:hypothetical protein
MVAGIADWTPGIFVPRNRSIGGIVAEVTIDEQARDELTITEHPIEQGAPIADHAFKRPATITIRAGWSVGGSMDLSAETGIYGLLLSWQAALMPMDVVTGKRSYKDMLIESISLTTDQASEFALMATLSCRQVILVSTQTTKTTSTSSNPNNHSDPSSTTPILNRGNDASVGEANIAATNAVQESINLNGGT